MHQHLHQPTDLFANSNPDHDLYLYSFAEPLPTICVELNKGHLWSKQILNQNRYAIYCC